MRANLFLLIGLVSVRMATGQTLDQASSQECALKFKPIPAPRTAGLVLKKGDRLAICGDSITEQRMYSRLMEDYLTMCVPQLKISVRQYGWSGERAPGFLARMTNDCLRFKPTVATTCYGMNDHEYRAYEERIGDTYRQYEKAIDESFKAHGVRVIEGSAGCVGKVPRWAKPDNTLDALNENLCTLRNIGIELAAQERVGFADVFWPMLTGGMAAQKAYGADYAIAGGDGVHPGWAGHTVMAYAFLKALGLKGDIGTFTVNLERNRMKVTAGHMVLAAKDGEFEIESTRYPFCPSVEPGQGAASYPICGQDDVSKDSSIRSGMSLVPFNARLNRLTLVATGAKAARYKVTWGEQSKSFSAEQLGQGVNLAAEFPCNPFDGAFGKVDAAVAAKQAYETKEIQQEFRSAEARTDMEGVAARCEQERAGLVAAVKAAFVPVRHTIRVEAE